MKRILLIVVPLIVIAGLVYVLAIRPKILAKKYAVTPDGSLADQSSAAADPIAKNTIKTAVTSGGCPTYKKDAWPLSRCMKGAKVKTLQTFLISKGLDVGRAKDDGYLGSETETAALAHFGKIPITKAMWDSRDQPQQKNKPLPAADTPAPSAAKNSIINHLHGVSPDPVYDAVKDAQQIYAAVNTGWDNMSLLRSVFENKTLRQIKAIEAAFMSKYHRGMDYWIDYYLTDSDYSDVVRIIKAAK